MVYRFKMAFYLFSSAFIRGRLAHLIYVLWRGRMCPIQQQSVSDRKCGGLVTRSGKHHERKFTRDFKQSIVSLSRGTVGHVNVTPLSAHSLTVYIRASHRIRHFVITFYRSLYMLKHRESRHLATVNCRNYLLATRKLLKLLVIVFQDIFPFLEWWCPSCYVGKQLSFRVYLFLMVYF